MGFIHILFVYCIKLHRRKASSIHLRYGVYDYKGLRIGGQYHGAQIKELSPGHHSLYCKGLPAGIASLYMYQGTASYHLIQYEIIYLSILFAVNLNLYLVAAKYYDLIYDAGAYKNEDEAVKYVIHL